MRECKSSHFVSSYKCCHLFYCFRLFNANGGAMPLNNQPGAPQPPPYHPPPTTPGQLPPGLLSAASGGQQLPPLPLPPAVTTPPPTMAAGCQQPSPLTLLQQQQAKIAAAMQHNQSLPLPPKPVSPRVSDDSKLLECGAPAVNRRSPLLPPTIKREDAASVKELQNL